MDTNPHAASPDPSKNRWAVRAEAHYQALDEYLVKQHELLGQVMKNTGDVGEEIIKWRTELAELHAAMALTATLNLIADKLGGLMVSNYIGGFSGLAGFLGGMMKIGKQEPVSDDAKEFGLDEETKP